MGQTPPIYVIIRLSVVSPSKNRPNDFANDQIKITYAVSWLKGIKGTALRWYEPNITLGEEDLPDYPLYWGAFEEALKATFGEPDLVTLATTKLDNLNMKNYHHITRSNVEFNEYSALTGYNDNTNSRHVPKRTGTTNPQAGAPSPLKINIDNSFFSPPRSHLTNHEQTGGEGGWHPSIELFGYLFSMSTMDP